MGPTLKEKNLLLENLLQVQNLSASRQKERKWLRSSPYTVGTEFIMTRPKFAIKFDDNLMTLMRNRINNHLFTTP